MGIQKVFSTEERAQVTAIVDQWVRKVGKQSAQSRMVSGGVSIAVAEKLAGFRYTWTPKDELCEKLIRVVGKDGFKLTGKKAS